MEEIYSRMRADMAKNGGKLTEEQEIEYAKETIAVEQPINERQKELLKEEKKEAEKNNLSEEEKKVLKAKENFVTELNVSRDQLSGIIKFVEKAKYRDIEEKSSSLYRQN